MNVLPCLASSYSVSNDEKKVILKIRRGVRFHDDPCFKGGKGPYLTAYDVKASLEVACSSLEINNSHYLLAEKIIGGEKFYNNSNNSLPKEGMSGIKVIDRYTLEINLVSPHFEFDKILTFSSLSIISKQALDYYKKDIINHPIGTGPFKVASKNNKKIILKRNNYYWGKDEFGNRLPFLDTLEVIFVKSKREELLAFRQKKIDIVLSIPVGEVENMLGSLKEAQAGKTVKHKVEVYVGMNINYVGFSVQSDEFKDANVRKAFNCAIDMNSIIENNLRGEGVVLNNVVPDSKFYREHRHVKGYEFDVKKAQAFLAKAGYPNGKNFPKLDFYLTANKYSRQHKTALGIIEQLKTNLNIDLKIVFCSLHEREKAIADGTAKIWKSSWIADYPSVENFLRLFYTGRHKEISKSVNSFGFYSSNYDKIYEQALCEENAAIRKKLFVRCNQLVMDNAVIIPVMTNEYIVMINNRVRDFNQTPMDANDFSVMYIKEPDSEENH